MIFALAILGHAYRIRGLSLYHWRDIAHFGVQRVAADIVSGISNKTGDFVIGRVIDFAAVGLFSRGKSLIRLFMQNVLGAIGPVTYPSYARMFRNQGNPHVLFLKALAFMTGIAWPFLGFAALLGFPIIRIMFGSQWDSVVPILQIVAIGSVFAVTTQECPKLFTAMGRIGLVTRIVVGLQFVRVPLLVLAAFHGLLAVAAVSIVTPLLGIAIYYPLLFKYTDLAARDVLHTLYQSLMVALSTLLSPVIVVCLLPPAANNLWPPLLLSAVGAAIGWLLGLYVMGHPIWPEMQSWLMMFFTQAKKKIKWVS
jgi:O-antigen/teichoic acid export membrane protein